MTDARLARPLWRGRTNVDALTIACIEHAEQVARNRWPETAHEFFVTQGSYQAGSGDPNSAGTHDLGGVVDLRWCGHENCLLALRRAGMAAWHRTPAQGDWPHHIHAVVIDHPRLSLSAAAQVIAYLSGRNGLGVDAPDDGPRISPIPRPVWPWPEEDDMPSPKDWDAEDWKAIRAHVPTANQVAAAVWNWSGFNNAKDKAKALLLLASGKGG